MRYRPFGRTGLSVSVVGFGCWPMAGDRYGAIEDDQAVKAIHRALDRGVNCVDTAPAYGGGHSEEVVERALAGRREDVILVTKCGVKAPRPAGPLRDASRANILREVDAIRSASTPTADAPRPLAGRGHAVRGHDEGSRGRDLRARPLRGRLELHRRHDGQCMRTGARRLAGGLSTLDRRQEREISSRTRLDHGIGVMATACSATASPAPSPHPRLRSARTARRGAAPGQPISAPTISANLGVVERLRARWPSRAVSPSQIAFAWVLDHPAISTALVGARTAEVDATTPAELDLPGRARHDRLHPRGRGRG
jgi:aryl-alcohol dehydrogenase-like predicted oxidoreductase